MDHSDEAKKTKEDISNLAGWAVPRRHVDAMNGVVKIALDGAHAIANRQCELMSDAGRQFAALLSEAPGTSSLDGPAIRGLQFLERALDTGLTHTTAMTEIAVKAQLEALTLLGRSAVESFRDIERSLGNGHDRRRASTIAEATPRGRSLASSDAQPPAGRTDR